MTGLSPVRLVPCLAHEMKGVDSAQRRNPLPFDLAMVGGGPGGGRSAPAAFFRARFAPPSSLGLVLLSGGAKSSHNFRAPARRRSAPAAFFRARFAPPSPRSLVLPSWGAKSSHNSRAPAGGPPLFSGRGLLPLPAKPCGSVWGEQNLHSIPAPLPDVGRLFPGAVCSPPTR